MDKVIENQAIAKNHSTQYDDELRLTPLSQKVILIQKFILKNPSH
jgi:hypothetical protein